VDAALIIVLAVVVVAVVLLLVRARAGAGGGRGDAERPDPARSTVRALRVGDVVNLDGHDCLVEQTIHLREDGYAWQEHLLVDGDWRRWLSVEDDEGLEVVVWERRPEPGLAPGAREVELDGVRYRFEERGSADYRIERAHAAESVGRMEYADYAAGDQRLSFERFGRDEQWEVSVGRAISEHALDIYPGRGEVP
jgi:hypothetical protein